MNQVCAFVVLATVLGCAARTSLPAPIVPQPADEYALRITAIGEVPGDDEPRARISLIAHGAHERTLQTSLARGICAHRTCSSGNLGVECWWKGEVERYCLEMEPEARLSISSSPEQR